MHRSYRGNLARVLRAVGYGPKILNMISSLESQMTGEPNTPYQETTPPLQAEEMGPQTLKEQISITIHDITSPPYD
jgi:hypothetical protein